MNTIVTKRNTEHTIAMSFPTYVVKLTLVMDSFKIKRLVHDNSDPSNLWIVTAIGHTKMDMEKVDFMYVNSLPEYESGCQKHQNCSGHLCKNPHGMLLPMQSIAISTPVILNDVYKAARASFEGSSHYHRLQHKTILADSMKKKTGRMRKGILNCHIDGSLRMIIGPHTLPEYNVVTIPRYLKDKWKVMYLDAFTNKYRERYVQDGDWAIVLRPPTLLPRSVQPCKIMYWEHTYMGISPYIISEFGGDYDGDEMHVYPVYSEDSIEECKQWRIRPNKKFETAASLYQSSNITNKNDSALGFIESTTMSFKEIMSGCTQPIMAEQCRMEQAHITSFRERYNTETVSSSFGQESIRGMADTNAQQLSQPVVGDMSRIAKLAAGNVIRNKENIFCVTTHTGVVEVCKAPFDEQRGSSCVRAISVICASTQQSKLQSHHAKKALFSSHDIISDMIIGGMETVVMLSSTLSEAQIKSSTKPLLYSVRESNTFILCNPNSLASIPKQYILASYNPIVLSMIPPTNRLEACVTMLKYVISFYDLSISSAEIKSLGVLFSFETQASSHPITTKEGILARNLRWTETMMANHYTGLTKMVNKKDIEFSSLDTISACLMSGNFREL